MNITKEMRKDARRWLKLYNNSGYCGGNKMLAEEAGMSYSDWMDLPAIYRMRMTSEITEEKRRIAK